MSCGSMSTRFIMLLAASTAMVMMSSSGPGTDLLEIIRSLPIDFPSTPHTLPISSGVIL